MRFSAAREVPQIAIVSGMLAIAIASWSSAPARIAVHWGASGEPDRYGGKIEGLLITPLIAAFVWFSLYFVQTLFDGKPALASAFALLRYAYLASFLVAYLFLLLTIHGITVPLGWVVIPTLTLNAFAFVNFIWRAVSTSRNAAN
jgi:hypothetical protein